MNENPLKHFMKRGDTEPPIRRQIIQASTGLPYDLTGATAKFLMKTDDLATVKINRACGIESPPSAGIVLFEWQSGDTNDVGNFVGEFQITLSSGKIISFPPGEFESRKSYIGILITQDLGD